MKRAARSMNTIIRNSDNEENDDGKWHSDMYNKIFGCISPTILLLASPPNILSCSSAQLPDG